ARQERAEGHPREATDVPVRRPATARGEPGGLTPPAGGTTPPESVGGVLTARQERVPTRAELVQVVAERLARLHVGRIGVERMPRVRGLRGAVIALDRAELRGVHLPRALRLARQRRPRLRASAVAG